MKFAVSLIFLFCECYCIRSVTVQGASSCPALPKTHLENDLPQFMKYAILIAMAENFRKLGKRKVLASFLTLHLCRFYIHFDITFWLRGYGE